MKPRITRIAAALLFALSVAAESSFAADLEKPNIRFSLSWLFQANQALFTYGADKGYFKAEGIEISIDRGAGSQASIQRIVAGSHDLGYTDVGTLVKYNAENPGKEMLAVYVPEEGNPLAIITMKDRNITKPKDLEGRKVGAPLFDGGNMMFPAFAKATGIDLAKVNKITVDAQLRETLLKRGEVDAVTGFTTSGILSLKAIGVPMAGIMAMKYQDYGVEGFGNAVIVSREFAEKNPKTVAAMVRAINKSLKDVIASPKTAVESLRSRDGTVDLDIEYDRMALVMKDMYITPEVKKLGVSGIDPEKLKRAIAAVKTAFNITTDIPPDHVYTDKFLPPRADREAPAVGPLPQL